MGRVSKAHADLMGDVIARKWAERKALSPEEPGYAAPLAGGVLAHDHLERPRFDSINKENGICTSVVVFYAGVYPEIREAARRCGYALALHGSLTRDLDVVAIPWTEDAATPDALVRAIVEASGGFAPPQAPAEKPHGRVAVMIAFGGSGGFIDLSIMPRARRSAHE